MDTKVCEIGLGAILKTADVFKQLFPGRSATVVADSNTLEAAGRDTLKVLEEGGVQCAETFIFTDGDLYAEWSFLTRLEEFLSRTDSIAVAVGSGVINDLCKLSSHHLGRPYMAVGTAASMDGYTSYGASITFEGIKQTFDCPAPAAIILDPAVAAAAPRELVASGYADLIAKIPAGADWILADALGYDGIDSKAWALVQDPLRDSLSNPDAAFNGDVAATEKLARGLIMSGFAMQEIKSSRPASGIEHQFSHFWDMDGLCINGRHVSHGFKVGIGTLASTAMLEFLLKYGIESIDSGKLAEKWPSFEKQCQMIESLLPGRPVHLRRAVSESRAKYSGREELETQLETLKRDWNVLKGRIQAQIMPFDEVRNCLMRVHAPYEPEQIGISRARFRDTFRAIPYMRSRFSCADVILRCSLMDEVEDYLFGTNGIWPAGSDR